MAPAVAVADAAVAAVAAVAAAAVAAAAVAAEVVAAVVVIVVDIVLVLLARMLRRTREDRRAVGTDFSVHVALKVPKISVWPIFRRSARGFAPIFTAFPTLAVPAASVRSLPWRCHCCCGCCCCCWRRCCCCCSN